MFTIYLLFIAVASFRIAIGKSRIGVESMQPWSRLAVQQGASKDKTAFPDSAPSYSLTI